MSALGRGLSAAIGAEVRHRVSLLPATGTQCRRRADEEADRLREELRALIATWRRLLVAHHPNGEGRCPGCRGWLRQRRWPCPVWQAAHEHLVALDQAEQADQGAPVAPPVARR